MVAGAPFFVQVVHLLDKLSRHAFEHVQLTPAERVAVEVDEAIVHGFFADGAPCAGALKRRSEYAGDGGPFVDC